MRRRDFAESLARAALVPLLGPEAAGFRLEPWIGSAASTAPAVPASAPGKVEPGPLARALAEAIRVQYGSRLDPGDLATITQQIQTSLERSEQVRRIELANGDEPDLVFSAVPPRPYGFSRRSPLPPAKNPAPGPRPRSRRPTAQTRCWRDSPIT